MVIFFCLPVIELVRFQTRQNLVDFTQNDLQPSRAVTRCFCVIFILWISAHRHTCNYFLDLSRSDSHYYF